MGGGVNPIEWIVPPVALGHMAFNAAAPTAKKIDPLFQAADLDKYDAPGSPNDIRDDKLADYETQQEAARQEAARRDALRPRPQTGEEEFASRQRAKSAYELLGRGKRRASQTLTSQDRTLSGSAVETL